jgi:ribonuclease-3
MADFFSRITSLFTRWPRAATGDLPDTILGYRFRNTELLREALTHRSYANSVSDHPTYERLEFLGDSVLGLIVAKHLFLKHPEQTEGQLTKRKASLVNLKTLTQVAKREGIGQWIRLSPEEDKAGGRRRGSILSDVFESVLGAIYLDGGLDAAAAVVERILLVPLAEDVPELVEVNYKGDLLEYLQGRGLGMPRYEVIDESGPDHQKVFTVVVHAHGQIAGRGVGSNKKDAEQLAAREALQTLGVHVNGESVAT